MSGPVRSCIGCGTKKEKGALLRLVAPEGRLVADVAARMPGRGAYVCGPRCAEKALSRRAVDRAFRRVTSGGEAVLAGLSREAGSGAALLPSRGDRG